MQCQQTTLDLGAKLAAEKRDRDQDFDQVSLRLVIQLCFGYIRSHCPIAYMVPPTQCRQRAAKKHFTTNIYNRTMAWNNNAKYELKLS